MKKKISVLQVTAIIGFPLVASSGFLMVKAFDIIDYIQIPQIKKNLGETYKYLNTNDKGRPITLDIKDNALAIIFDKAFDEEAKRNAKYAISELDEILPSTKINIYQDGQNPDNNNYIKIDLVDSFKDSNNVLGKCKFTYSPVFAKIDYPIQIEIVKQYTDDYFDDYSLSAEQSKEPSNSVFTHIIQHEVMHAFGFKDLQKDDEGFEDSVMAYTIGHGTKTYSELDKYHLQHVYEDKSGVYEVTTTLPSQMTASYQPIKEHDEGLEF